MSPYEVEFLESAEKEFLALRKRDQRLFEEKLLYLTRNPYRSFPWLRVRQGARHPGEWRFHLGESRVLYRIDGLKVVITRIVARPMAYPRRPPKSRRLRWSDRGERSSMGIGQDSGSSRKIEAARGGVTSLGLETDTYLLAPSHHSTRIRGKR